MNTARINRAILAVQSGQTDSEKILNRPAGFSYETRGRDWRVRTLYAGKARDTRAARSEETFQRLKPHLEHITLQVPGFHWRPTIFRPTFGTAPKDHIKLDLEFGERKWNGPYAYTWRAGNIEIVGRKVRIYAHDAIDDNGVRNMVESVRLDGSILVVNTGKNPSALERIGEYVAALAAEGLEAGKHWRREDYEEIHGAEIRTPHWVRHYDEPKVA